MAGRRITSGIFTKTHMDENTKRLHVVAGELAPDDFDKSGTYSRVIFIIVIQSGSFFKFGYYAHEKIIG